MILSGGLGPCWTEVEKSCDSLDNLASVTRFLHFCPTWSLASFLIFSTNPIGRNDDTMITLASNGTFDGPQEPLVPLEPSESFAITAIAERLHRYVSYFIHTASASYPPCPLSAKEGNR